MDLVDKVVRVQVIRDGKTISYYGEVLMYGRGEFININDQSKPALDRFIRFHTRYSAIKSIILDDGAVFYSNPVAQGKLNSSSKYLNDFEFRELRESGMFLDEVPMEKASSE